MSKTETFSTADSQPSGSLLLEARGLSRRYGHRVAVHPLDLNLLKGEILGLLGPNGAGKSTTMKMLAGCLAPSAGSISIGGVSLADEPARAKASLGYLPEQPPVYPELTVDEYLLYCAALHGVPAGQQHAALGVAKRGCGLTEVGKRLIGNLSKGFQQRVGLAQAIIHQPQVVILDEPTVGLDPIQIREIRSLIRELGKTHSVILSSHILPEIQAVCDRVMIINKGRLVYAETMAALAATRFSSVLARFKLAPPEGALLTIPGISAATSLGENLFRLTIEEVSDPRSAIAEAAVGHGWGLIELRAEARTLEEIFVELTSGDIVVHDAVVAPPNALVAETA